MVCADGRNFVSLTTSKYDLISTGVLTPYRAGVSRLYTIEHFQHAWERLKPGGLLAVWIPIRQISLQDLKTVTRTLQEVTGPVSLWLDGYYLALIATGKAPLWRLAEIFDRAKSPTMLSALQAAALSRPHELLALFWAGPERLRAFSRQALIHTEDRPVIEFRTPRLGSRLNSLTQAEEILEALLPLREPISSVFSATGTSANALTQAHASRMLFQQGLVAKCRDRHERAYSLFAKAVELNPSGDGARQEICAYELLRGQLRLGEGETGLAAKAFHAAARAYPRSIHAKTGLAILAERSGARFLAAQHWRDALAVDPFNQVLREQAARFSDIPPPER